MKFKRIRYKKPQPFYCIDCKSFRKSTLVAENNNFSICKKCYEERYGEVKGRWSTSTSVSSTSSCSTSKSTT